MNEMDLQNLPPELLLQILMSGQMLGPQEEEQARMFAQADELRGLGTDPGAGQMVGGRWMPNYAGAAQRGMGAYHGNKEQKKAEAMGPGIAQEQADQFRRAMAAYGMRGQAPQQVTQGPMPQQPMPQQPVPQQQPPMPQGGMMPASPGIPAPPQNPLEATPIPWSGGR